MLLRFDTIAQTAGFDQRAAAMQLRPWQWRFLLAADGRTRLDDLAHASGIDFDTAVDLVHETEALGLIEIVAQTLERYRESQRSLAVASAPLTFAASAAAPIEAEMPLDAPPNVPALPGKKLSVSFDALASIFAETTALNAAPHVDDVAHAVDVPDVIAHEAVAHEAVAHEANGVVAHDAHELAIDELPFAFETPDHMEPLGDRTAAFGVPPASYESHEPEPAPVDAPAKSVSFSLNAEMFGAPSPSFANELVEVKANGHAHVDPFDLRDILHDDHEHAVVPLEPVMTNGRSEYADMFADEHHDTRPVEAFESAPMHEVPSHDVAVHDVAAAHDVVAEPAPDVMRPADDVLLQHFHVPATAVAAEEHGSPTGFESDGVKAGGDLTGNLLRALGLKK